MNVNQNLLFQMYQMIGNGTLSSVGTTSNSQPSDTKSSFQDLMEQASSKESTTSTQEKQPEKTSKENSDPKDKQDIKDTKKDEDTPSEEAQSELSSYVNATYVYRPDIPVVSEETTTPELLSTSGEILVENTPTTPQTEDIATGTTQVEVSVDSTVSEQIVESSTPSSDTQSQSFAENNDDTMHESSVEVEHTNRAVQTYGQEEQDEDTTTVLESSTQAQQPIFDDVDTVPTKVGETYELDTTAPDAEQQLADTIRQAVDTGTQKIELQLTPEHLGRVTIEMTQTTDGTLQIVMHTANAKSASLLTQSLDTLTHALQTLGQTTQIEVQHTPENSASQQQTFQQANPDGHNQQQQQQQQQQHQGQQQASEDFLQQLRLGLFSLDESQT